MDKQEILYNILRRRKVKRNCQALTFVPCFQWQKYHLYAATILGEKCPEFCPYDDDDDDYDDVAILLLTRLKITSVITRVHKSISVRTQGSTSQHLLIAKKSINCW
jgi:hypothetical protein